MSAFPLALAALFVSGISLIVAVSAVTALRRARRHVRRAQLELVIALQTAGDAEAGKVTALRLLEEQRRLRVEELQTYRAQRDALQIQCDQTIREYRAALALDKPLLSRRLQ